MPTLLTNPRAASGGAIYALLGRMAHRNSPDEYVVQASGLLDHAIEGHGRLPGGRTSLSPVFGIEAAKPAAIKRTSSTGNKKKAVTTGPKKKRRPPKVPWKKPKDMPKRPLSAYNLFFAYERERLLQGVTPPNSEDNSPSSVDGDGVESKRRGSFPEDSTDPSALKRRHLKTSGIGFANLAKTIASKWKHLDDSKRSVFEAKAAIEKEKYQKEMLIWRAKKKEEADLKEKAVSDSTPATTKSGEKLSTVMARRASDPFPTSVQSQAKGFSRRQSTTGNMPINFESSHMADDESSSSSTSIMEGEMDGMSLTSMPDEVDVCDERTLQIGKRYQHTERHERFIQNQDHARDYHRRLSDSVMDLRGTFDRLRSCEEIAADSGSLEEVKDTSPTTASLNNLRSNLDSETVNFLTNLKFDEKIEEV